MARHTAFLGLPRGRLGADGSWNSDGTLRGLPRGRFGSGTSGTGIDFLGRPVGLFGPLSLASRNRSMSLG